MEQGFATRAIHAGQEPDPQTGAVIVPLYLTSTYAQSEVGVHRGYEYSRTDNPTRTALQTCLASLENGKHSLTFASGLAATTTIMLMLPLLGLFGLSILLVALSERRRGDSDDDPWEEDDALPDLPDHPDD